MEVIFQTHQYSGTEKPEITTPTHATPVLEIFAGDDDTKLNFKSTFQNKKKSESILNLLSDFLFDVRYFKKSFGISFIGFILIFRTNNSPPSDWNWIFPFVSGSIFPSPRYLPEL